MKEVESEFKGCTIKGWKCECGEELLDPIQTNVILKLRKAFAEKQKNILKTEKFVKLSELESAKKNLKKLLKSTGKQFAEKGITEEDIQKEIVAVRNHSK